MRRELYPLSSISGETNLSCDDSPRKSWLFGKFAGPNNDIEVRREACRWTRRPSWPLHDASSERPLKPLGRIMYGT